MVRLLTDADVRRTLELDALLPVIAEAIRKQDRGAVERPDRPHFPVGAGDEPASGTALTMPAYIHGADTYATKLATVVPDNPDRDLPTVTAQVTLTDATTGQPVAYMAGNHVTNARTGCIGGLSARALADPPVTVGVVGAGTQARWQTRAIAAATTVDDVRIYSPSGSKHDCAMDLREEGIAATASETAVEAVRDADVVVTATTATEPVIPTDALAPNATVVAVGAYTAEGQELEPATLTGASDVFADVPAEAAATGDGRAAGLKGEDMRPLSAALDEQPRDGRRVVLSVGSAVFDAAAAAHVHDRAVTDGVGRTVEL
ncbi:ornithine cyclodeaminase family protein [Halococcus sediminicola]|uniref:ornithine cyclodeaminase family protein n=1 Tax=Halococcus sediminicola TaxID=1264579 RepID=UPI000678CF49|nr:ornithine cyclodeaminase family protein [Halococcus sediminicola]